MAAYVDVPNALPNVITPRPTARLCCTFTGKLCPGILLEVPDAFREEAGSNEVEKACRYYQENL